MRAFEYSSASHLDELVEVLAASDGAIRPLAGGTDLLPLMKLDVAQPQRLIDLKHVPDLPEGIHSAQDGLSIGALTKLSALESSPLVSQRYSALAEAVAQAATPQLRNMATLGGNLLQRPRCWYFRSSHFPCWLKGGETCFAREGENQLHAIHDVSPCVAVHPSDPPAALLALNADVETTRRRIAISEFYTAPSDSHRQENVLEPGELITRIHLPPADGVRSTYRKAMNRKVWAFALVGVAAAVRLEHNEVTWARVVLNGVAPIPWRAERAEAALLGQSLDESTISNAAQAALSEAQPLSQNAYKLPLARGLIQQALRSLRG
jgi:xanthine dehydrogenase YagS FAD-binding subunit